MSVVDPNLYHLDPDPTLQSIMLIQDPNPLNSFRSYRIRFRILNTAKRNGTVPTDTGT